MAIIVINDGTPDNSENLCKQYGLKYLFTGERNVKQLEWRSGIIAINSGVAITTGDILVISCAEMYYIDDCISRLIQPLLEGQEKSICIPIGKDDRNKTYLQYLEQYHMHNHKIWESLPQLKTKLPFLIAIMKKHFTIIDGYDKAFLNGRAYDDTDFMMRLLKIGCTYTQTTAKTVHLYHSRRQPEKMGKNHSANMNLYISRHGKDSIEEFLR